MRTGWSSLKIIFTHHRAEKTSWHQLHPRNWWALLLPERFTAAGRQEKLTTDENKEKPANLLNFTVTYGLACLLPDENADGPKSGSVDTTPILPTSLHELHRPQNGMQSSWGRRSPLQGHSRGPLKARVGKQSKKAKGPTGEQRDLGNQKAGNWARKQSKLFQGLGKLAAGLQNIGFGVFPPCAELRAECKAYLKKELEGSLAH